MRVWVIERQAHGLGSCYEFFTVAASEDDARFLIAKAVDEDDWRDDDDYRYSQWVVYSGVV